MSAGAEARAEPGVTLQEITAATVRAVIDLSVRDSQAMFVAPNAVSLAEALFKKEAWYRAIVADGQLAGFVMLFDEAQREPPPAQPRIALWRLMIDQSFQRRGIGTEALRRVVAHVRAKGLYHSLQVSYYPGEGCPEPFYRRFGFQHTGRLDAGEVIMELPLDRP